jgi:hypothetical protein
MGLTMELASCHPFGARVLNLLRDFFEKSVHHWARTSSQGNKADNAGSFPVQVHTSPFLRSGYNIRTQNGLTLQATSPAGSLVWWLPIKNFSAKRAPFSGK